MYLTKRSFFPSAEFLKRIHFKSFLLGAVVATAAVGYNPRQAEAIDFSAIAKSIQNLSKVKRNLDNDVKALTADAKTLFGDKDNLLAIKEQLVRLATETRTQIDSITTLVGVVEGHIKTAQTDIAKTSKHVDEIDDIRKALEGK